MKAAISIPDDLYAEAEELARRLNLSRSRLFADAVREYLARHDPDAVTEALNRVWSNVDPSVDPAVSAASSDILRRVEW